MTGDSIVVDAARALFQRHGWRVRTPDQEPLLNQFIAIAENELAIVFVSTVDAAGLEATSRSLGGAIAALLQGSHDDKAWEAYLVLVVALGSEPDIPSIGRVERDLTYCRRTVIALEAIVGNSDPVDALGVELAFLFPLSISAEEAPEQPSKLLIDHLIARGNDPEMVNALVMGIQEPKFDAVSLLLERESGAP